MLGEAEVDADFSAVDFLAVHFFNCFHGRIFISVGDESVASGLVELVVPDEHGLVDFAVLAKSVFQLLLVCPEAHAEDSDDLAGFFISGVTSSSPVSAAAAASALLLPSFASALPPRGPAWVSVPVQRPGL